MRCPVCDETLREVQKHSVTVDICPGCKGVWLDRGEMEKIVDMVATDGPRAEDRSDQTDTRRVSDEPRRPSRDDDDDHEYREKSRYDERGPGHKKRRGSWLGEIFEGFGGD